MMDINIKLMTEVAYLTLQKNPKDVYNNILNHPLDNSWLRAYLGFEPFETKKYSIEDFELKTADDYSTILLENCITLYEHLKVLPRYILCNPRFWAWITFEKAYKEAQSSSKITGIDSISSEWLITNTRKSLMLGVMSRFFFMVQISVDETKVDKYKLTNYLLSNEETYRSLCYRNISMLKNVTLSVIRVQKDICERFNITLTNAQIAAMIREASKIGSVMLIDVMTQGEIYEIIYPKFLDIALEEA